MDVRDSGAQGRAGRAATVPTLWIYIQQTSVPRAANLAPTCNCTKQRFENSTQIM